MQVKKKGEPAGAVALKIKGAPSLVKEAAPEASVQTYNPPCANAA